MQAPRCPLAPLRKSFRTRPADMPTAASPDPVFCIRAARSGDLDSFCALEQAGFAGDRLSRRQFRRHLSSRSAVVLVAAQPGELLGNTVVFFRRHSRVARLYSLVCAREVRGRGIGRALLDAAERLAGQRGCVELRLEVRGDNPAAIGLYESAGYRRFEQRQHYYEDGADAWRYRKVLVPNPS